ncbi:3,4-dihydroxy-2-butanone-4-phosphate synthase [Nocardia sp. FBN12]|uniref:3,4-dihydroxy-2-butanone-4-phosphate synthase n=1 Tax=Nocardia sp. FBN12 TaxID=3419766 RepID=UPI003CFD5E65
MAVTLDSLAAVQGCSEDDACAQLAAGAPIVVSSRSEGGTGILVAAAASVSTSTSAFMVRHSSGLLQIALPSERCERLLLPPMNPFDTSGVRVCVAVDAIRGTGTGISAADRATTARALAGHAATAEEFTRPGHLIPVSVEPDAATLPIPAAVALDLVGRAGMSNGALFAGLVGIADPTRMITHAECVAFADRHALPLHTV